MSEKRKAWDFPPALAEVIGHERGDLRRWAETVQVAEGYASEVVTGRRLPPVVTARRWMERARIPTATARELLFLLSRDRLRSDPNAAPYLDRFGDR